MAMLASARVHSLETPWQGQISHGNHQYLTDKPEAFGGQDRGPAPYDFLLAGLISCTMITLRMYAQHKGIEWGAFSVEADFNANKEGREWISRRLSFEQTLTEEARQKILDICQKTPVTKTLLRSVEIETSIV